jgi:signal transduction histidine kinase
MDNDVSCEPAATAAEPHTLRPYAMRALRSAGYGTAIGVGMAGLRDQPLTTTLAYALPIAMLCWLSIDLGRLAVARLRLLSGTKRTAELIGGWPGWQWMVAVVIVGSGIGFSGGTAIGNRLTGFNSPGLLDSTGPREALSLLLVALVPAIIITYFFYFRSQIDAKEAAILTAQRQAAEHQLKLLESQLEPHMLFNTLANLRVLIGMDPPRAQAMLDQLIAFLRSTLSASRAAQHTLGSEFSRLADYLALMQVRMGARLQTRLQLPESLAAVMIPPLLLQPLVENAIKHGLEPSVGGGRIDVVAEQEGRQLKLTVRDTGVGLATAADADSTSFGLTHVRERLATLYGDRAGLDLAAVDASVDAEGGTCATIHLPLPPSPSPT